MRNVTDFDRHNSSNIKACLELQAWGWQLWSWPLSPMVPYITFQFNVCLYFIPEDIYCHTCHSHTGCAAINPTWKLQLGTQSVDSPVWKRSTACAHGEGSMWRREREREDDWEITQVTSWKLVGVLCHGIFMYFPLIHAAMSCLPYPHSWCTDVPSSHQGTADHMQV